MSAGAFVPMFDPPRQGARSARVGWVVAANGCHLWQGARDSYGYGQVKVAGRTQRVHRVRYEREVGPIPDGMDLDHYACDNGAGGCGNPQHCLPVTLRENLLRGETVVAQNARRLTAPKAIPSRATICAVGN